MGFFDSIKGLGRVLGGFVETGIQAFGPTLAQAGVQALSRKLNLGPAPSTRFFPAGPAAFQAAPMVASRFVPRAIPLGPIAPTQLPFLPSPLGPAPGGPSMPAFPVTRAAFDVGSSGGGFFNELTERLGGAIGGQTTFFRQGGPVARAVPLIMVPNPVTGAPTFFKHAGRPILFSGDLTACKRVARIASRARRVSRKR